MGPVGDFLECRKIPSFSQKSCSYDCNCFMGLSESTLPISTPPPREMRPYLVDYSGDPYIHINMIYSQIEEIAGF